MKIKVAQRYRPFSHKPGAKALLPLTTVIVEAFPTKILIGDEELNLEVTGPVKGFTLIQDLERGEIRVFGTPKQGYYEFLIRPEEWILARAPKEGIQVNGKRLERGFKKSLGSAVSKKNLERLALGCHKEQEFEKIADRKELSEILPLWFFLGQQLPQKTGSHPLLTAEGLLELFQVSFSELFFPTFSDGLHLGLKTEGAQGSPISILTDGAELIRALFFKSEKGALYFLPNNSFSSGRFIDIQEEGVGTIHFEWTKKKMRRVIFESAYEGDLNLYFPKDLKSFRLRNSENERGRIVQTGAPIFVQKEQKYLLDNFQK